jgi:GT2 family glycosyltransferase
MEGVRTVRSTWILVVEDDCQFPPDYGQVLLAEAARLNADIVGAPWVYDPNGDLEGRLARLMANRVERLSLESPAGTFPQGAIETPFMPNLALVSAAVFDRVHFDPGFRGNSWREETAFYISAVRAGFRCFLTDRTHSVQIGQWQGGQRRSRLAYEYWVWRNEVRFMRLHGKWLTERNFVRRRRLPSVRLVAARLFAYAAAGVNARVARLRRRSLAS